jgi:hypothetical protein
MEMSIYTGFGTLKIKCTQYEICEQVASKNARTMIFSKLGGRATIFNRIQKIKIFWRRLPLTEYSSPEKFVGGT